MAYIEGEDDRRVQRISEEVSVRARQIQDKGKSITIRPGYIGLCFSCQSALIWKDSRANDPTIICNEAPRGHDIRPLDIVECNRYSKMGELDIWDMVKSTKIVDLSIQTKTVGFKEEK